MDNDAHDEIAELAKLAPFAFAVGAVIGWIMFESAYWWGSMVVKANQ
jgi:hypothetical protein